MKSDSLTLSLAIFDLALLLLIQGLVARRCERRAPTHFRYWCGYFKVRLWEPSFYARVLRIQRWKARVPVLAGLIHRGYDKKHLPTEKTADALRRFVQETCRAELAHMGVLPFTGVFALFNPVSGMVYTFVLFVFFNLPCVFIQRYNRPRMLKMLEQLERPRQ